MNRQPLLLISRRDLIEASDGPQGRHFIDVLAGLTRQGFHFVATASQPDDWSRNKAVSKRSRPGPKRLRDRLDESGGVIDGVYYIPQSLLTQKTQREDALKDILERFGTHAKDCYLLSSNKKLLTSASKLGVNVLKVSEKNGLLQLLEQLQQTIPD